MRQTGRGIGAPIGAPIVAGFIGVLALMASLTAVGLHYIGEANARLTQIVEGSNVKTELAVTMRAAIRERVLSVHALSLMSDPFDEDGEVQRLAQHEAAYIGARLRFEEMPLSSEERAILQRIGDIAPRAREEVIAIIEMSLADEDDAITFDRIRTGAMPLQRAMAEQLDILLGMQQEQAAVAERMAAQSYRNARDLMLVLAVATLVTGLGIAAFVSQRVTFQARQLSHQALHDGLTGLANRALLLERLANATASACAASTTLGVALMDLDRFKKVNDTLGHEVGDELLREVAERLTHAVRPGDLVARLGGDEFVVIFQRLHPRDVPRVLGKLLACLERPFAWEGQSIDLDASIGVSLFPQHGETPSALLRHADIAMYAAKRRGLAYAIFAPEQKRTDRGDLSLKSELREAIQSDQLTLHYQPKIAHHTQHVVELEALVRWHHPERGFLPPDKFIPLAEDAGLIGLLTEWVLRTALCEVAELQALGYSLAVAVNLSPRNLQDEKLPETINALLTSSGIGAEHLILEITENAVMDNPDEALTILTELDRMGVTLSIDDFGTGYSSLAYLKRLPVDEIKIDQSFVKDMVDKENDAVIVRAIVDLAHALGLRVTAEGVETQSVWEALSEMGCDNSQGFYMSRPLPAAALRTWLRESPWRNPKPAEPRGARPDRATRGEQA